MPSLAGSCYCGAIAYAIRLGDAGSEARTSLCHCGNCKKPADNGGGGVTLHREFCGTCGGALLEYGARAAGEFVYVFYGTLDDAARAQVAPKGEFFCKQRDAWMPEIEGLFHKQEIKE
ncbi:Mss4-like protein [Xylariomycetidae sp. FL0641]|nr:Mss4-like protein [Xylariomycetidae sp. FL0641]